MEQTNRKKIIIGAVGGIAAIAILYFGYQHFRYVSTDNAQVDAHVVILAAKVGGYIKAVNIQEGETVQANQILAEIDPRDYQNALDRIKGESVSVQARERDNERNFNRLKDLLNKGVVSQQQFDAASASYLETKAKDQAVQAQLAQAELDLSNTKIVAPADGIIAKRSVEVGQLAAPGMALIGFVSSESRWITANFKETEIESIQVGAPVYVEVDALSGKSFTGKVSAISAATGSTFALLPPDNSTGNFTKVVQRVSIKIELTDVDPEDFQLLRAGLSANVRVTKR